MEGDLADYNLALDKQRTDTRPEEVQHMYFLLKGQNDQQRQVGFLLASSGPRETYEKKDGIQRTDREGRKIFLAKRQALELCLFGMKF